MSPALATIMKKLLIITNKLDTHADYIIHKLNEIGADSQIIRLNTEDMLTNAVIGFNCSEIHISLKDSGREFSTSDLGCVWYRRPESFTIPETYHIETHKYVQGQMKAMLDGLYYCADQAFWINPRNTAQLSSNKLKQLQVAKQIGFKIPTTIITNSPDCATKFIESIDEVCIKSYSPSNITVAEDLYPFFTIRLTSDEKQSYLDNVAACPTLFQQFIDKVFDLRVIVIGENLYAVEIHSQGHKSSQEDFRVVAPEMLAHKLRDVPKPLHIQIKDFMNYYNLVFSAFDFAVTANGDYYFLENNPNGQWLWLEVDGGRR